MRLTVGRQAVVVRENEAGPLHTLVGIDGEELDLAASAVVSIAWIL